MATDNGTSNPRCVTTQVPAGSSAYGLGPQAPDGSQNILDDGSVMAWDGRILGQLTLADGSAWRTPDQRFVWADDSRHACALLNEKGLPIKLGHGLGPPGAIYEEEATFLWLATPGEPARRLVELAPAHAAAAVLACSWAAQRAVVMTRGSKPSRPVVVDLASGKTREIPLQEGWGLASAVANPDGSRIGLTLSGPRVASRGEVVESSDGSIVGTFEDATVQALSYSGDTAVIVRPWPINVSPEPPHAPSLPQRLLLVNSTSGRVLDSRFADTHPAAPPRFSWDGFIDEGPHSAGSCRLGDREQRMPLPACVPGHHPLPGPPPNWEPATAPAGDVCVSVLMTPLKITVTPMEAVAGAQLMVTVIGAPPPGITSETAIAELRGRNWQPTVDSQAVGTPQPVVVGEMKQTFTLPTSTLPGIRAIAVTGCEGLVNELSAGVVLIVVDES